MGDIGNKTIRHRRLQVGDTVRIRGVDPSDPAYDTGTLVAFTFNGCKVRWRGAGETYSENPRDLDLVSDGAGKEG